MNGLCLVETEGKYLLTTRNMPGQARLNLTTYVIHGGITTALTAMNHVNVTRAEESQHVHFASFMAKIIIDGMLNLT